jgi:hypothetical protein
LRSSTILRNISSLVREAPRIKTAEAAQASLTTNQGVIVADNQNTLKSGGRGPSLLEDLRSARRSPISITSEFQSASFTPADLARTAISR